MPDVAMGESKKLKCGVVGVGHLGQHHARILAAHGECDLVGICDIDMKRAEKIATRCSSKPFDSLEELGAACDAISIAVPTDQHCKVSLPLLRAGCHILIEKPICRNLVEAERILEAANKTGTIVQVGHVEHFNPVMGFLEEVVNRPRFIKCDRLAPYDLRGTEVGVVLDLMIHDIGVVLALVKSPILNIEGIGVNVFSRSEDIANARIVFRSGCVANINVSRVSEKKTREIRVFQENTYLSLDFIAQRGHLLRKEGLKLSREEIPIKKGEPLDLEIASFIDCVSKSGRPKVGADLGISALEVAIRITEQIKCN